MPSYNAMLPASRSSDTHRVSRVPWFPTVSSITHGALNERTTIEDCRGWQTWASWATPSAELAAASPLPGSPHAGAWGSTLAVVQRMGGGGALPDLQVVRGAPQPCHPRPVPPVDTKPALR